jgi:hypothetical protein
MPDNLILMVDVESGQMAYMHSVDASEAAALGDYRPATAEEYAQKTEEKAAAFARTRGGGSPTPPELMSREERQEVRRQANAVAAQTEAVARAQVALAMAGAAGAPAPGPVSPVPVSVESTTPPPPVETPPPPPPPASPSSRR